MAKLTTRLHRIDAVGESDWAACDLDDGLLAKMIDAQRMRLPVEIVSIEVDTGGLKEHSYYDIVLEDGSKIHAISGYHLVGINDMDLSSLLP